MELRIPEKTFICIDYPTIVQNAELMLQTLGGECSVAKTVSDPSKRLELCFRGKDAGCRPLFGTRQSCAGLLLKVRRRRRRVTQQSDLMESVHAGSFECSELKYSHGPEVSSRTGISSTTAFEYSAEVLGIVDTVFSFNNMSDFQYLPMVKETSGTYKSVQDRVLLTDLQSPSWMNAETPLYLLPQVFSRFDDPLVYCYRDPPKATQKRLPKLDPNVIGISRRRRSNHTYIISFDNKILPVKPHQAALDKLAETKVSAEDVRQITEKFRERPVWSRNALAAQLQPATITIRSLAVILPTIAYYFGSGPWRGMWIRFGYDPRQDPAAKLYQLLDIRAPRNAPESARLGARRSDIYYRAPHTVNRNRAHAAVIQPSLFDRPLQSADTDSRTSTAVISTEATYLFWPGVVPAYRQMFYQLCDIDEPEVHRMVHENDGCESECVERDGWCLPETLEKCRAIVSRHIAAALLKSTSTAADDMSTQSTAMSVEDNISSASSSSSASESDNNEDPAAAPDSSSPSDDADDDDDNDETKRTHSIEQLETDVIDQLGLLRPI